VLVDRWASTRSFCSVSVDDVYGGELAAPHLLEQGHTRIVFVGGPFNFKQVSDRFEGARRTLAGAGLPDSPLIRMETPATDFSSGAPPAPRSPNCPAGAARRPYSAPTTCWPSACSRR
jgi:LacI family transcriptional regulator